MKSYGMILLYIFTWRSVITAAMFLGLLLLALKLFIITSVYTGLVQLLLPSQHALMAFSPGPFLILFLLNRFDETLWRLYNNDGFIVMLAYPATISIRLVNIAYVLIVSPLVCAILLKLVSGKQAANAPDFFNLFLLSSLCTGCISSWAYGEIGARARLIWLRIGGSRGLVWRQMEVQLCINIVLLSCLTLGVVLISTLLGKTGLMHYPLLIVACAFYDGYRNLCARVYGWSSPSQALLMLASFGVVVVTVIATFRNPELNLLFVIEIGMMAMAVLFRALSKIRFSHVDWQVVKPVLNKRAQAAG